MNHSYIVQEGHWNAAGFFTNSENRNFPVEGSTQISHTGGEWVLESWMEMADRENITEYANRYRIDPLSHPSQTTSWNSSNTTLGNFRGLFAFFDDTILSTFSSTNHKYTGVECVSRVDPSTYNVRGILLLGDTKISSWALTLKKQD